MDFQRYVHTSVQVVLLNSTYAAYGIVSVANMSENQDNIEEAITKLYTSCFLLSFGKVWQKP